MRFGHSILGNGDECFDFTSDEQHKIQLLMNIAFIQYQSPNRLLNKIITKKNTALESFAMFNLMKFYFNYYKFTGIVKRFCEYAPYSYSEDKDFPE
jgi:hypothetical protein